MNKEIINDALVYQRLIEPRLIALFEEANKVNLINPERNDLYISTIFKHMYPDNEKVTAYKKVHYINSEENCMIPEDELVVANFTLFIVDGENIQTQVSLNAMGAIMFYHSYSEDPLSINQFYEFELSIIDRIEEIRGLRK